MSIVDRPRTYSVAEVAQLLGLHEESVRRMIREGRLSAARASTGRGGGAYRISAAEVERLFPEDAAPTQTHTSAAMPLQHRALGKYLLRSGLKEKAAEQYQKALAASRQLEDQLGQAKALYKLGQIALRTGRVDDARRCYAEAFAIFDRLGDRGGLEAVVLAQADLALESGANVEARAGYERALLTAGPRGKAAAYRGLGHLRLLDGETQQALQHLSKAQEFAVASGDLPAQANILRSFARTHQALGDDAAAAADLRAALSIYRGFGFRDREEKVRAELEALEERTRERVRRDAARDMTKGKALPVRRPKA